MYQHPPHRLIGTFYLENAALVGYTPQTWETQPDWRHRWMYSFVRDGNSLERTVMMVCQAWHQALQHHPIWYRSISLLDPMDHYQLHQYLAPPKTHGGSARQSQRRKHTPWKHLRNILWVSCFVCRINAPVTSIGLGAANCEPMSFPLFVHSAYALQRIAVQARLSGRRI